MDTMNYIRVLKTNSIDFIQKFVDSVEKYIDEKKYKSA